MVLLRERGLNNQGKIVKELGYTSFYRDRKNPNSPLSKALRDYQDELLHSLSVSKAGNLEVAITLRDNAMAENDIKNALAAVKLINDMQGHNAPAKKITTKINVDTVIDLTKEATRDADGEVIYDIGYGN